MSDYLVTLATIAAVQVLLVLGLNVQFGLTGLVNFGQVAFYAIGAYTSALLTVQGVRAVPAAALGMAIAVLAACLVGLSTLRLREDYFAILTLGFSEAVRLFLLNAREITKGPLGVTGIPRPLAGFVGTHNVVAYFVLVAIAAAVAFALCQVLAKSPLGRTLRAVRDDDQAAAAVGKDVLVFRLTAFGFGAALASISGSLWAHYVQYVAPDQFTPEITFYAWMAMIVGGVGSMRGAVAGTVGLVAVLESTRFARDVFPNLDATRLAAGRQIVIGLGLIWLTVYARRLGARRGASDLR